MQRGFISLVFLLVLVDFCLATKNNNNKIPDGAVKHDLFKKDEGYIIYNSEQHQHEKRAGIRNHKEVPITPSYLYYLNVSLGDPQQKFVLNLDTKSSDLWVFDSSVKKCSGNITADDSSITCVQGKSFDKSKSKKFKTPNKHETLFNKTYLDGTEVSGLYGQDTLRIPGGDGLKLDDFTFGIANHSSAFFAQGALGIGFQSSEGVVDSSQYNDLLTSLYNAGYIYTSLASLWLDSNDTGSLLFGAIDTEKYKGKLYVLPINRIEGDNDYRYPFLTITEISVANGNKRGKLVGNDYPVLLDPGSIVSFLPYDSIVSIATQLNAMYNKDLRMWTQSCSYRGLTGTINFHFNDAEIKVPVRNILLPIYSNNTRDPLKFGDGDAVCALAFKDSNNLGYASLGAGIMANIYTVFDRDNRQIGIAQAKPHAKKSNIQVVANNLTSIKGVKELSNVQEKRVVINEPNSNSTGAENGAPRLIVSGGEAFTTGGGGGGGGAGHNGITALPTSPTDSTSIPPGRPGTRSVEKNIGTENPTLYLWSFMIVTFMTLMII